MESPHWIFMVCAWSADEIKIIHYTWNRMGAESVNYESSGYIINHIDVVDWNEPCPTCHSVWRMPLHIYK